MKRLQGTTTLTTVRFPSFETRQHYAQYFAMGAINIKTPASAPRNLVQYFNKGLTENPGFN
jgi:hypothetical protein